MVRKVQSLLSFTYAISRTRRNNLLYFFLPSLTHDQWLDHALTSMSGLTQYQYRDISAFPLALGHIVVVGLLVFDEASVRRFRSSQGRSKPLLVAGDSIAIVVVFLFFIAVFYPGQSKRK